MVVLINMIEMTQSIVIFPYDLESAFISSFSAGGGKSVFMDIPMDLEVESASMPTHSIKILIKCVNSFPGIKNPPANAGDLRCGFELWVRKIPWSQVWQAHLVFLPGVPHGQRSLKGYSL